MVRLVVAVYRCVRLLYCHDRHVVNLVTWAPQELQEID
jgi:hypothetical protein